MTTKETFLKQRLNNFIIFIGEKIGTDNNIYKDFLTYQKDINLFLRSIIEISAYATTTQNGKEFPREAIIKYLDMKGVDTKQFENKKKEEDFLKLNRYFNMFLKVIEV